MKQQSVAWREENLLVMKKGRKLGGKKSGMILPWISVVLFLGAICLWYIPLRVLAEGNGTAQESGTGWVSNRKLADLAPVSNMESTEITLDPLGNMNLVSFFYNDLYPTFEVVLTDAEGNILFELAYLNGLRSRVFDVFVEDMDGDGLDDIKVILGFKDSEGWDCYRVEWNHYQRKEGGFGRMPEGSMQKNQSRCHCTNIPVVTG